MILPYQKILMCAPDYYDVKYAINPYMPPNINNVNKNLAMKQWENLYKLISNYCEVKLIEGQPHLPDMVFTANGGLWVTEQQMFIASNFATSQRSPESDFFIKWVTENMPRVHIKHLPTNVFFEGAGDCLRDNQGRYWLGQGNRTCKEAQQCLKQLNLNVYPIKLVTPEFYHLDTCFAPLPNGKFLVYPPAISIDSLSFLLETVGLENIIYVDQQSAEAFACNVVPINDILIMNTGVSSSLIEILAQNNFSVVTVELSEFMKAGGSAKCLTLDIS